MVGAKKSVSFEDVYKYKNMTASQEKYENYIAKSKKLFGKIDFSETFLWKGRNEQGIVWRKN